MKGAVDNARPDLRRWLAAARLYVLVDGCQSPAEFSNLVRRLVSAGVHAIQLRDKRLTDRELIDRAKSLCDLAREGATLAVVNDRADVAVLSGADGVHVGQDDLGPVDVRAIVGPDMLVGVSTHSLAQARQAERDGADYIGVGPTFPSDTKHFEEFPGLELARTVAGLIHLPAFAIGGISHENVDRVRAAGLNRVCVGGAITRAADPGEAAARLLPLLGC